MKIAHRLLILVTLHIAWIIFYVSLRINDDLLKTLLVYTFSIKGPKLLYM